jgi:hypothetical protein
MNHCSYYKTLKYEMDSIHTHSSSPPRSSSISNGSSHWHKLFGLRKLSVNKIRME